MQGTVIVTGGNSGIGQQTALELARRGAHVVLACRDRAKAEEARAAIAAETREGSVSTRELDLASLASVRRFAAAAEAELPRIDVLVNNAGIFPMKGWQTEDGFEAQFGVNHLGPFLLTTLLRDKLRADGGARVVHVSSMMHARGDIDFGSFRGEKPYKPYPAYYQSKLANILFSNELARREQAAGSAVTSNALHPGAVATNIMRDGSAPVRLFTGLFFGSVEKGARTSVMLASDPALAGVTGRYYHGGKEREPSAVARDEALAAKLWEESAALCGVGT
jgi:NAD(P)-dependent dehydrogenase (short-subunit alcohol dehydrogenase family)